MGASTQSLAAAWTNRHKQVASSMKGVDVILFNLDAVLMEYLWLSMSFSFSNNKILRCFLRGPNIEGCNHCSNYEYGCCEDELTPAYGPNMEVDKSLFMFLFKSLFRAVVVKVLGMAAAWKAAPLQVQTIWVA